VNHSIAPSVVPIVLGKNIVRTSLKILEVRTGKEIEVQDVEVCRSMFE
jgi:hypothetical protein